MRDCFLLQKNSGLHSLLGNRKSMRVMRIAISILLVGLVQAAPRTAPIRFQDVGPQAGLTTMPHFSADKRYLVDMMAGGIGLLDCDNDGKLDIVSVTDSSVERYLHGGD